MQEQQGVPNETTPEQAQAQASERAQETKAEQAPGRTHEVKWRKRGQAPALRAAAYPRRVPSTSGLSTRDLRLLGWMCEQYGARLDHIQALTDSVPTLARRIARNLRKAGLVRTERILVGEPTWVIPTAEGMAASGLPYDVWTPRLGQLMHVCATNVVRIHVQTRAPQAEWISERQIMWECRQEDTRGRTRSRKHIPDGVTVFEGQRVAIEVELGTKDDRTLARILDELARHYDATLYYCSPRPHKLLERMERSGRWANLGVRELPELPPIKPE